MFKTLLNREGPPLNQAISGFRKLGKAVENAHCGLNAPLTEKHMPE